MSAWIHNSCASCWEKRNPFRQPQRSVDPKVEVCCYCGRAHNSGIFIVTSPGQVPCGGQGKGHLGDWKIA